jgi:hypothetical protein
MNITGKQTRWVKYRILGKIHGLVIIIRRRRNKCWVLAD